MKLTRLVLESFWADFGRDIPPRHPVSVAEGWVEAAEIVDARGKSIPGLEGLAGEVALFFVDENPRANWGHACCYIVYPRAGGPAKQAEHRFPPGQEFRLMPLATRESA